jgi:D-glycero-alpha-D-manno-heptose-7-phosphate kinase
VPHQSYSVNRIWVNQFVSGKFREHWKDIITCTREFATALGKFDFSKSAYYMNRETAIRRKLTPNVLDDLGKKLVQAARKHDCGARFTGAGAGGCLWALGETENVRSLKESWQHLLNSRKAARLLDATIDVKGLVLHQ